MDEQSHDAVVTRRSALAALGTGVGVGLAGCLGGGPDLPDETPTGPVATAPVPDSPGDYRYARTAAGDPAVTATYFGNWKCPFCADFSTGFLGDIVTEYVQPGDLALEYRGLAYVNGDPFLGKDAPRAAEAGLAVWHADPDSYWRFHEYVMANQPPESKAWATTDTLVTMAEKAGVSDVEQVRSDVERGAWADAVRKTSEVAAVAGIGGTPALLVGDSVVNPLKEDQTRSLLDSAVESAGDGS